MNTQNIDNSLIATLEKIIAIVKKEFPESEISQRELLANILSINLQKNH